MSVINQMLQDLDKRNSSEPNSAAAQARASYSVNHSPQSNPLSLIAKGLGILAIVSMLAATSYYLGMTKQAGNTQANDETVSAALNEHIAPPLTQAAIRAQKIEPLTIASSEPKIPEPVKDSPISKGAAATQGSSVSNIHLAEPQEEKQIIQQKKRIIEKPLLSKTPAIVATRPITNAQNKTKKPESQKLPPLIPKQAKKIAPAANANIAISSVEPTTKNQLKVQRITLSKQQLIAIEQNKANLAKSKGDLRKTRTHLKQILKIDAAHNKTRSELAALYFGSEQFAAAIKTLEQGLVISPNYAEFRLLLARMFAQQGNHLQAYYYLKPLRPPTAEHIDYHAMLAALAQKNSDNKVAEETYLALVTTQPEKAQWWLGLAISQDALGEKTQAKTSYKKAQLMGQLSNSSRHYIEQRLKQLVNY